MDPAFFLALSVALSAQSIGCIKFPAILHADGEVQQVDETYVHPYSGHMAVIDQAITLYNEQYVTIPDRTTELWLSQSSDLFLARTSLGEPVLEGIERVNCRGGDDFVLLFDGDPELQGVFFDAGPGNDVMWAGSQPVFFDGSAGNDVLLGGPGDDLLRDGSGNNYLWGGDGSDRLFGGSGSDFLSGGDGDDRIRGSEGRDTLLGGAGVDQLEGEEGDDHLEGGGGPDVIDCGEGNDFAIGGEGNDELRGEEGDDELHGGPGDDELRDAEGHNSLYGEAGDDLLESISGEYLHEFGIASAYLDGGDGADIYVADIDDEIYVQIRDDADGAIDVLWIVGFSLGEFVRDGDDLVIERRYGYPYPSVRALTIIDQYAAEGAGLDELWFFGECVFWDEGCVLDGPDLVIDLRSLSPEDAGGNDMCRADLTRDGVVGAADLSRVLAAYATTSAAEDFDENGWVDAFDISVLLAAWGDCPPK